MINIFYELLEVRLALYDLKEALHFIYTKVVITKALKYKAGQTEFAVYRHRPHGFSGFLKKFQISDTIQQIYSTLSPTPSSDLIGGRGLSDFKLERSSSSSLYWFEI